MTDLEKITNLIKSNDESNWKLAFELSNLLSYEDKLEVYVAFHKKDSRLCYLKWQEYYNLGMFPVNTNGIGTPSTFYKNNTTSQIIKDLTKILKNGKNNNT